MTEIGFGIFFTNADGSLSTNHTFRLINLSYNRVFKSFKANLDDLLSLHELCNKENIELFRLGSNFIPFVFDFFHHSLNPSEIDSKEIFKTWTDTRIPKIHLSSQGNGKRGVHGDYIKLDDYLELMKLIENSNIKKIHIMIEANKKEIALINLRELLHSI